MFGGIAIIIIVFGVMRAVTIDKNAKLSTLPAWPYNLASYIRMYVHSYNYIVIIFVTYVASY